MCVSSAYLGQSWRAPACAVDGKVHSRVMKLVKNVFFELQQGVDEAC